MKRYFLFAGLLLGYILNNQALAQININISSQPLWGPAGYDNVNYYYFPDKEAYYSVPDRQYIYSNNGKWVKTTTRPTFFQGFNLNEAYKVVINEPQPYLHHQNYKVKYAGYKGKKSQPIIRYSNDPKYYVIAGHPKKVKSNNAGVASVKAKSRANSNSAVARNNNNVKTSNGNKNSKGKGNGNGKNK